MLELLRLLYRRLASGARLFEVAKTKQVPREISEQGGQRLRDVERHVERAVRGIKSGERLLQGCAAGQDLAELDADHPSQPGAHRRQRGILALLAKLQQFDGDLSRLPQRSLEEVIRPLAVEHRHDLRRSVELLAQGASPGVGLA